MENKIIIETPINYSTYLLFQIHGNESYIFVSLSCPTHRQLFEKYTSTLSEEEKSCLEVLGGGIITKLDEKNKEIIANCMSRDFGKTSRKLVKQILKQKYPDYNIEAKID